MKKNLVSIIMSCYNGEKYLNEAIESVINQSYANWELIFWDNFSSDNSAKITKKFNDNRIKYFRSTKKTNLAIARNNAIKKSNGEFICFLDTDDFWLRNKLKEQINILKKNSLISVTFCNYFIQDERSNILKKYIKFQSVDLSKIKGLIFYQLLDGYVEGNPLIGPLSVMIRKKILDKKIFDVKLHVFADFDLFLKLSENNNFQGTNNTLAVYRLHQTNESFRSLENYNAEYYLWFNKIKNNPIYNNYYNYQNILDQIYFQKFIIYSFAGKFYKMYKIFPNIKNYKKKIKLLIIALLPSFFIKTLYRR